MSSVPVATTPFPPNNISLVDDVEFVIIDKLIADILAMSPTIRYQCILVDETCTVESVLPLSPTRGKEVLTLASAMPAYYHHIRMLVDKRLDAAIAEYGKGWDAATDKPESEYLRRTIRCSKHDKLLAWDMDGEQFPEIDDECAPCGLLRAEIFMLREVKYRLYQQKESCDKVVAAKLKQMKVEEKRVKDAERRARQK